MVLGVIICIIGLLVAGWGFQDNSGSFAVIVGSAILLFGIVVFVGGIIIKRTPSSVVAASVFAKTLKTSDGDPSYIGNGLFTTDEVSTKHFISFEFDNRRESVEVPVSLYNTLAENDVGLLEYKDLPGSGFEFISFQRQA